MKVKISQVYSWEYYKGGEEYNDIVSCLKAARLPIIEKDATYEPDVEIYTEISTLEDLNRLVDAFGCHIVYGDKTSDGIMIIEKYDTYRE